MNDKRFTNVNLININSSYTANNNKKIQNNLLKSSNNNYYYNSNTYNNSNKCDLNKPQNTMHFNLLNNNNNQIRNNNRNNFSVYNDNESNNSYNNKNQTPIKQQYVGSESKANIDRNSLLNINNPFINSNQNNSKINQANNYSKSENKEDSIYSNNLKYRLQNLSKTNKYNNDLDEFIVNEEEINEHYISFKNTINAFDLKKENNNKGFNTRFGNKEEANLILFRDNDLMLNNHEPIYQFRDKLYSEIDY